MEDNSALAKPLAKVAQKYTFKGILIKEALYQGFSRTDPFVNLCQKRL